MKIHVENIPASKIVYMRCTGAYGEQNYKLMQDMKEWIRSQNLWNDNGTVYGIAQDNAVITLPEQCRYDVCLVTDRLFDDTSIHHGELPSGAYLVFEILHTAEEVGRFWGSIDEALQQEGKQIDNSRPILERYQILLVEKGYCEFCVPILL